MRDSLEFRVRLRITNRLMCRFANRQLWPLAVLMLRIPRVITTGHPFQVAVGLPPVFIDFFIFRLLWSNLQNYATEAPRCTPGQEQKHGRGA